MNSGDRRSRRCQRIQEGYVYISCSISSIRYHFLSKISTSKLNIRYRWLAAIAETASFSRPQGPLAKQVVSGKCRPAIIAATTRELRCAYFRKQTGMMSSENCIAYTSELIYSLRSPWLLVFTAWRRVVAHCISFQKTFTGHSCVTG